jgi:hypothetical protein
MMRMITQYHIGTGADFMSILSQIGVVVLIGFIILVLVRSNKTLEEVYEEGEHFVDEWDLRQQKKKLRTLEKREEKVLEKVQEPERFEESEDAMDSFAEREENISEDYDTSEDYDRPKDYDTSQKYDTSERYDTPEERDNIIPMKRYRNTGITLVEMNEQHRPVRRISVNQIPFSIGRDRGNHLVLDDLCVAKKHCQIIESQGVYTLEDVGTKNKLFVNGMITDKTVLSDQLRFFIGNVEFCVEMGIQRSAHTRISQGMREIL